MYGARSNVEQLPDSSPRLNYSCWWLAAEWLCLGLFVTEDPWSVRDGIWFQELADALPYFFLTPLCGYIALRTAASRRRVKQAAWLGLLVYLCLPLTWRFAWRVVNQMIPVILQEYW